MNQSKRSVMFKHQSDTKQALQIKIDQMAESCFKEDSSGLWMSTAIIEPNQYEHQ